MNIFFVHSNPEEAARQLPNAHVVKMILESCQLMCTTLSLQGVTTPYKPTHRNHPSRLWVEESPDNFVWLLRHTGGLISEYHRRYGEHKVHKCEPVLKTCRSLCEDIYGAYLFAEGYDITPGLTPIKLAMPDELKKNSKGCHIVTYQRYMREHKNGLIEKTIESGKAEAPEWFLLSSGEFDVYESDMVANVCSQEHRSLCQFVSNTN